MLSYEGFDLLVGEEAGAFLCDWQMMEGAEELFCDQVVALHQVLLFPLLLELVVAVRDRPARVSAKGVFSE